MSAFDATRAQLRETFARIAERCDLPPLPAVASRAIAMMQDPDTTADAMAALVASDAALASRVLRVARSVLYARRRPPTTLHEAIVMLGFEGLKQIVVAASVRSAYRVEGVTATALWDHGLATALAAHDLARRAGGRGGDAFLAGLMHDLGRLVFHLADPAAAAALGAADEAREQEVFGVTHAAAGACLAEQWGVEDAVVDAIMSHHHAVPAGLAHTLATADRIADAAGYAATPGPAPPAREQPVDGDDDALPEAVARLVEVFPAQRALFV